MGRLPKLVTTLFFCGEAITPTSSGAPGIQMGLEKEKYRQLQCVGGKIALTHSPQVLMYRTGPGLDRTGPKNT